MSYWEHVLVTALGIALFAVGLRSTGSGALGVLFVGAALAAWGLFGGIEVAVRRGFEREGTPQAEPEE